MSAQSATDRARLLDLVHGYRTTCIIAAALELGLIDALAGEGASDAALADGLGVNRQSLARLLRAMAVLGIAERGAAGTRLAPMGRLLADAGAGVRERARLAGSEYLPAWHALAHSVRTGESAFAHVFGMSAWEHRERHPELGDCLNRTMADDQKRNGRAVTTAYDFSGHRLVVDVGGGEGALVAEILTAYPQPAAIVFDQPHVVAGAASVLAAAGVHERCRIVGGSFFDAVPEGGDAYVLQHILHDWNDERGAAILSRCRSAMAEGGVLLVIENILPDAGAPSAHLAMLDLHMLTMLAGAERTRGEYAALLRSAGFELQRSVATRAAAEILVAAPR